LNKLRNRLWDRLDTSIWFVPVIISVVAVVLAFTMVSLDRWIAQLQWQWQWLQALRIGADGVRQVLTVTTGATMTITGVVFSVTVVSLTLASNQLGPKVLRNYLRDTGNKMVLGLFVGAFLYGLLVLASIDTQQDYFVPTFSAFISLAWTIAAIAGLIYFIHNIATMIQADYVIALIGEDLNEVIEKSLVSNDNDLQTRACEQEWTVVTKGLCAQPICALESGYIQSIDYDGLTVLATRYGCFLEIGKRAGHFVVQGVSMGTCFSVEETTDDLQDKFLTFITLARQRTPLQDIEFEIEQLLQIALKALSPGINDSSTGITCIDWLSAALGSMARCTFPSFCFRDAKNTLRMVAYGINFAGLVDTVFDPLRQSARGNEMVTVRLLEALDAVMTVAENSEYRAALLRQAELIHQSAMEAIPSPADRQAVSERFDRCQQKLDAQEPVGYRRS